MVGFTLMKVLGIETSCDETAVAVLEIKNGKIKVLSIADLFAEVINKVYNYQSISSHFII